MFLRLFAHPLTGSKRRCSFRRGSHVLTPALLITRRDGEQANESEGAGGGGGGRFKERYRERKKSRDERNERETDGGKKAQLVGCWSEIDLDEESFRMRGVRMGVGG